MSIATNKRFVMIIASIFVGLVLAAPGLAQDYEALSGLESVRTVFDFRDGKPQSALIHLKLIHQTYKDKAFAGLKAEPEFMVVFMGDAVKLFSAASQDFSPAEKEMADEFVKLVPVMAAGGIKFEVCLFAGDLFKVDPKAFPAEIKKVPNGWISALGYQQKGYALIPVF